MHKRTLIESSEFSKLQFRTFKKIKSILKGSFNT